jgi:heterodisulfide reductase subunit B
MRVSYYPGCSLESTGKGYDRSARAVCAALGVDLQEVRDWVCCGSSSALKTSRLLSTALSGANLAVLEAADPPDVVAPCPFCFRRLAGAQDELNGDAELKAAVEDVISAKLSGALRIHNLVDFLRHEVGLAAIAARLERPLAGLKVVPYYGCSTAKPRQVTGCANPEDPASLDEILGALGAEVLAWDFKTECCGAGLSLSRTEVVVELSGRLVREAAFRGADVIAVACPLCQANLDMRQGPSRGADGAGGGVPAVYFTQLMGLAFGLGAGALGLDHHLVDPRPALERRGRVG